MIKYLVISGGLYYGLHELGALACLHRNEFYSIENIEKIYGSSVGGIIGALLCLKIDWSVLLNYFEKRPWQNIMSFEANKFLDLYTEKGLYGEEIYHAAFDTLLKYKNLSPDITMKELYDFSHIELNLYSIKIDDFTLTNISYKTHPNMKLITAFHCSSSYPLLFKPAFYENKYYIDGGILLNYPMNFCIEDVENKDEILGIDLNTHKEKIFTPDTNVFKYGYHIISSIMKLSRKKDQFNIKNELIIPRETVSINKGSSVISDEAVRTEYIQEGEKYAKLFLAYKKQKKLKSFS